MRSQQAKFNFSAGVRSPRVTLRADYNQYQDRDSYNESLSIGQNWIVTPQGGIMFREGFRNMLPSTDPGQDSRIFQFHRGGELTDMVVTVTALDGLIHFYTDGVAHPDTVAHPYSLAELDDIWFTNQERLAVILHKDHPPLYIDLHLDGSITGGLMESSSVPWMDYEDENSPAASLTGSDTYTCTWVDGATAQWDGREYTFRYNGVFATGNQGKVKTPEYFVTPSKQIERLNLLLSLIPEINGPNTTYSVVGTAANVYEITITGQNAGKLMEITPTNENLDHYATVENEMVETDTTEPAWSYPTYVEHPAGSGDYYQCLLPNTPVFGVNDPLGFPEYWLPLAGKPETFDWQYPDGNVWTADVPTGDRQSYAPGGRGFPTVGIVYEQRLFLMANPSLSMGVFGSRIGNYRDFALGPQDNDPVFFAIDTSDSPTIKWAAAQRKMIMGTSSGDYALDAEITITPSNVQATKQNSARSHHTYPVTVNTDIFYIQRGREKMRATSYNDDIKSQTSIDISVFAQHLLHSRVKRLTFMQTPETLIFGLREDNTLVGIAYSPEHSTAAWFEFICAGTVIDICGAYNAETAEDELWALMTYDGGTTRWLEKMPYPARVKTIRVNPSDDALVDQGIVCMDGWISGQIVSGDNNIISGLDQFEGLEVTAMVDDAYAGNYTVVDGAILLSAPPPVDVPTYEGTYAVGFDYLGNAKTFEVTQGNQKGVGFGTKRRWNKLYVRILDSSLPKINGQLPYDRHPATNMSVAEIIQEGLQDREIANLDFGDGSITILQDRPYPCHILGFFGEIEVENA